MVNILFIYNTALNQFPTYYSYYYYYYHIIITTTVIVILLLLSSLLLLPLLFPLLFGCKIVEGKRKGYFCSTQKCISVQLKNVRRVVHNDHSTFEHNFKPFYTQFTFWVILSDFEGDVTFGFTLHLRDHTGFYFKWKFE